MLSRKIHSNQPGETGCNTQALKYRLVKATFSRKSLIVMNRSTIVCDNSKCVAHLLVKYDALLDGVADDNILHG